MEVELRGFEHLKINTQNYGLTPGILFSNKAISTCHISLRNENSTITYTIFKAMFPADLLMISRSAREEEVKHEQRCTSKSRANIKKI